MDSKDQVQVQGSRRQFSAGMLNNYRFFDNQFFLSFSFSKNRISLLKLH